MAQGPPQVTPKEQRPRRDAFREAGRQAPSACSDRAANATSPTFRVVRSKRHHDQAQIRAFKVIPPLLARRAARHVPALDPGRRRTRTGYPWAVPRDDRGHGGADPPMAVRHYAPGRGGEHAERILEGFNGVL